MQNGLEVERPVAEPASPWERRAAWAKGVVANIRPRPEMDRTVPAVDDHHVYIAYSAGRIKIGTSFDVSARLRGLNTQSPHPVTVILTFPGNKDIEQRLHSCLDSIRLHGEWFQITPEMRKFLDDSLCRTGKRKFKRAEAEFRRWMSENWAMNPPHVRPLPAQSHPSPGP